MVPVPPETVKFSLGGIAPWLVTILWLKSRPELKTGT